MSLEQGWHRPRAARIDHYFETVASGQGQILRSLCGGWEADLATPLSRAAVSQCHACRKEFAKRLEGREKT